MARTELTITNSMISQNKSLETFWRAWIEPAVDRIQIYGNCDGNDIFF